MHKIGFGSVIMNSWLQSIQIFQTDYGEKLSASHSQISSDMYAKELKTK